MFLDLGIDLGKLEVFFLAGMLDLVLEGIVKGMGLPDVFSSSSDAMTSSLHLPKELEVKTEVVLESCRSMSIGLIRVSVPALLFVLVSSTIIGLSSVLLSGIGGAVCIAENALPPLAVALGIMS